MSLWLPISETHIHTYIHAHTHTHTHTITSINPYTSGRIPGSKTFLSIGSLSFFTSISASLFYSLFHSSLAFSSPEPLKVRKVGSRLNQEA